MLHRQLHLTTVDQIKYLHAALSLKDRPVAWCFCVLLSVDNCAIYPEFSTVLILRFSLTSQWKSLVELNWRSAPRNINTASITQLSYLLQAKLHDFPQSLRVHFEKKNNPLSQFIKDHRHCQNCHVLHSHSVSSQFLRNLAAFSNSITVTLYLKWITHTCMCP